MMRLLVFFSMLFFGITLQVITADEIVVDFADPMFARLDAEGKRLLSEYARTYPKIKSFYENIRMDVNVGNASNPSENDLEFLRSNLRSKGLNEDEIEDVVARSKQMERQYEIRYRLSEKYARIDTKVYHPVVASARIDLPSGGLPRGFVSETGITLFTPTMGYQLSKNDPSKQYFALNAKRDVTKPNVEDLATAVMYFDVAPFSSDYLPLENIIFQCPPLIKGKPYVVEYVRQREIDSEPVVEIRVARTDFTDVFREIKLDKNSWVVLDVYSRVEVPHSSGKNEIRWDRSVCTYDGAVDGVPLLKTYQRVFGNYNKDTQAESIAGQMQCEVTKIVPGPVDLSEFDVAQFLPPDVKIGEVMPAQLSSARIATIVIGIILVIFGIYLKLQKTKER
jgi:hypothetical protein